MRQIVETGTDVASLCFFDPVALPDDFDERLKREMPTFFQQLSNQGRLWWMETGADGSYLFHFYVDEQPPKEILTYTHDPKEVERFLVPSGKVFACGAEYVTRHPVPGGKHSPTIHESFEIQPGEYSLTAWRAEWPDNEYDSRMKAALGMSEWQRRQRISLFATYVIIALILAGIFLVVATISPSGRTYWGWKGLFGLWVGFIVLLNVVPRILSRFQHSENGLTGEVESSMPSIVIHMRRRGGTN
jgi:drug/metabolite transporter superfamily protein YnfA